MTYLRSIWGKYPDKRKRNLLLAMGLVTLFRLWLTSGQQIAFLPIQEDDDTVFLSRAAYIVQGLWLGEYNQNTLVKGTFYSIYVALIHLTGLPLLLAQQILYVFACIVFIIAIRKLLPNRIILTVIYCISLFNPGSYTATATARVIRDFICATCAFMAVSAIIAIYARTKDSYKTWIPWAILLGVSFSATMLTREDSAWVIPIIAVASAICFVMALFRQKGWDKAKSIAVLILPFAILAASSIAIAGVNFAVYGNFVTNEYADKNFTNAYSALCRIDGGKWISDVPVTRAALKKGYAVSEALRELEPYLSGEEMSIFVDTNDNETHGTLFTWNLRNAAAKAGYYKNAATSSAYFKRLAKELNTALDSGKLNSYPNTISLGMLSPWRSAYFYPTVKSTIYAVLYDATFRDCSPFPILNDPTPSGDYIYQAMTNEVGNWNVTESDYDMADSNVSKLPFILIGNGYSLYKGAVHLNHQKLTFLNFVTIGYQKVFPILFVVTSVIYLIWSVYLLVSIINKKAAFMGASWLVSTGVFLTFFLRVLIFAYGHVSSDVPIIPQYMVSAYFQMAFFVTFTLGSVIYTIFQSKKHQTLPHL